MLRADLAPKTDEYLTSPEHALAARQVWEDAFVATVHEAFRAHHAHTALVATAFPRWSSVASRILGRLPQLPMWAVTSLYQWQPGEDDDETASAIAATFATAAYNMHVLSRLAEEGYPYKVWVTRRDVRVRAAHVAMDTTAVKLGNPFVMEGYLLQYPADRSTAPPELTFRCRCVLVGSATATTAV